MEVSTLETSAIDASAMAMKTSTDDVTTVDVTLMEVNGKPRLEYHALHALQNINNDRPEPPELPKYELRPQTRNKPLLFVPWMDHDQSGDYDPIAEEQQRRLKRPRTQALNRSRAQIQNDASRDVEEHQDITIPTKPVILRFEKKKKEFGDILSRTKAQEQSDVAGYKLRRRCQPTGGQGCTTHDKTNTDTSNTVDLTAKPFTRGCWACAHLTGTNGQPICSLVNDERSWPCQSCSLDNTDCELIVAPTRKLSCELCKRRRVRCSYIFTRNHGASCQQCTASRCKCVAGPAKEYIRHRISYNRNWESDPLPKRRKNGKCRVPEDCVECRQKGTDCLYPTNNDGAPCASCKHLGLPCSITDTQAGEPVESAEAANCSKSKQPTDLPRLVTEGASNTREKTKTATKNHAIQQPSGQQSQHRAMAPRPSPLRPSDQTDLRRQGFIRKILTNFSHPIVFNCDQEESGSIQHNSCHFCIEPGLSVFGFGTLKVEIIDYSDYTALVETRGGHAGQGVENTRLCAVCTTERMSILCCGSHQLQLIPGVRRHSDEGRPEGGWLENSVDSLCRLCRNLAVCECVSEQDGNRGCGLKLCGGCARVLADHRGKLQVMLASVGWRVTDEKAARLRADVEFLRKEGPLMRYLKLITGTREGQ